MQEFKPVKEEKKFRCPQCGGALVHMGFCDPCKARRKQNRRQGVGKKRILRKKHREMKR